MSNFVFAVSLINDGSQNDEIALLFDANESNFGVFQQAIAKETTLSNAALSGRAIVRKPTQELMGDVPKPSAFYHSRQISNEFAVHLVNREYIDVGAHDDSSDKLDINFDNDGKYIEFVVTRSGNLVEEQTAVYRCHRDDMESLLESWKNVLQTTPVHSNVVVFSDKKLESAIQAELDLGARPVTRLDMLRIHKLDVRGRGIESIDGLEHALNLADLNISHNKIKDLGPIKDLQNISILIADYNEITEVSDISKLNKLNMLNLSHNKIRSLEHLGDALTSLEWLDLDHNLIDDISPLTQLTRVHNLKLSGNRIIDAKPFALMHSVTHLELHSNHIFNFEPFTKMQKLAVLRIANNILDMNDNGPHLEKLASRGVSAELNPRHILRDPISGKLIIT